MFILNFIFGVIRVGSIQYTLSTHYLSCICIPLVNKEVYTAHSILPVLCSSNKTWLFPTTVHLQYLHPVVRPSCQSQWCMRWLGCLVQSACVWWWLWLLSYTCGARGMTDTGLVEFKETCYTNRETMGHSKKDNSWVDVLGFNTLPEYISIIVDWKATSECAAPCDTSV